MKTRKHVVSSLLLVLLLIVFVFFFSENVVRADNDNMPSLNGCGTQEEPYEIYSYDDFCKISEHPDSYYRLCADIDGVGIWEGMDFSGTFDGNGHVIKNIASFNKTGIFKNLNNAYIHNLCIYIPEKVTVDGVLALNARDSVIKNCLIDACINGHAGYINKVRGCVFEQCEIRGDISYYDYNTYVVHLGGFVSWANLDVAFVQNKFINCLESAKLKCECVNNISSDATVGGIAGSTNNELGYIYSVKARYQATAVVQNCLVLGEITNREYGNKDGIYSKGPFKGVYHVSSIGDTGFDLINSYYNMDLNSETKGDWSSYRSYGKTTAELGDCNSFVDWDFDNVWKIENGYPRLRGDIFELDYKDNTSTSTFEIKGLSEKRIARDESIVLSIPKNVIDCDADKKISINNTNTNKSEEYHVNITEIPGVMLCTITSENNWDSNSKYDLVIPKGYFVCDDGSINEAYSYSFSVSRLIKNTDKETVPESYIARSYPKDIFGNYDKTKVPFPSSNSDYIKQFREWASYLGYSNYVDGLTDTLIEQILNTEYSSIFTLEDNSYVQDANTNKTVKDCMNDILMIQYAKEYLVQEENRMSECATTEELEGSVKRISSYYERIIEYMGKKQGYYYDPLVTADSLLNYLLFFDLEYWSTTNNSNDVNEVIDLAPIIKGGLKLNKYVIDIRNDDVSELFEKINKSSSYTQAKEVLKLFKGPELKFIKNVILSDEVNYTSSIKDFGLGILDNLIDKIDESNLLGDNKIISKSIKGIRSLSKLKTGAMDEIDTFGLPVKLLEFYMKTAVGYLNYINNMYPTWLFYSKYYMNNAAPEKYSHIWNVNSSTADDRILLQLGQGLFTADEYSEESDPVIKLLMAPLVNQIASAYNIYSYQNSYIADHNIFPIVDAAEYLSKIRIYDQKAAAKALIEYALNTSLDETYCELIIACPTDVEIINIETNETIVTIRNNMAIDKNYGEYGSFCLLGDDRDVKCIVLKEGYNARIIPTDSGTMNCQFIKSNRASEVLNNRRYDSVAINPDELYIYNRSNNDLKKIVNGEEFFVEPSNVQTNQDEKNDNINGSINGNINDNTRTTDNDIVNNELSTNNSHSVSIVMNVEREIDNSLQDSDDKSYSSFKPSEKVTVSRSIIPVIAPEDSTKTENTLKADSAKNEIVVDKGKIIGDCDVKIDKNPKKDAHDDLVYILVSAMGLLLLVFLIIVVILRNKKKRYDE